MAEPKTMWWCPTCQRRIPQPRWMNMGKPTQRSYHTLGLRLHDIEKVPVLDGELVIMSTVSPDEMLPGESMPEAMARLRRAVVVRGASAST